MSRELCKYCLGTPDLLSSDDDGNVHEGMCIACDGARFTQLHSRPTASDTRKGRASVEAAVRAFEKEWRKRKRKWA